MKIDFFVSCLPLVVVFVFWSYGLSIGWIGSFVMVIIIALQGAHIFCLRKIMNLQKQIHQMEYVE